MPIVRRLSIILEPLFAYAKWAINLLRLPSRMYIFFLILRLFIHYNGKNDFLALHSSRINNFAHAIHIPQSYSSFNLGNFSNCEQNIGKGIRELWILKVWSSTISSTIKGEKWYLILKERSVANFGQIGNFWKLICQVFFLFFLFEIFHRKNIWQSSEHLLRV